MKNEEQAAIFKRWLQEHKGLLFKVIRANAFILQEQEDLFQEISLQLWRSIPTFNGKSSESTWIYRVALFASMSWNRKEQKHRKGKREFDATAPHSEFAPESQDPRLDWLYEQISQLPTIDRSLTLLMLDGYSYREMSDILGLTESNVGVRLNRIKKELTKKSQNMEGNTHGI